MNILEVLAINASIEIKRDAKEAKMNNTAIAGILAFITAAALTCAAIILPHAFSF